MLITYIYIRKYVKERDIMTYEKIVIPMDHGNRNMKTKEDVFTSGLVESDLKPVLGEYLEYNGKYYSLTGERIPYMRDKTLDDRFFILTLFGIGKELERRTQPQKDTIYQVELPVGLPPKHYGALFEKFGQYFVRPGVQRFTFNKREYLVQITKAAVFPQDYAAAMTIYPQIAAYNRGHRWIHFRLFAASGGQTGSVSMRFPGKRCHYVV